MIKSIPIEFLHVETVVILLFLGMVARTEMGRATEPKYDVFNGIMQLRWLPVFFVLLAVILTRLLFDVSPLLGLELAIGITLSMFHPVNALCFMLHLMILRPWEIAANNTILLLIPRFGVSLCLFSWLIHPQLHANHLAEGV